MGFPFPSEKMKLDPCPLKSTYLSLHPLHVQPIKRTHCLNDVSLLPARAHQVNLFSTVSDHSYRACW